MRRTNRKVAVGAKRIQFNVNAWKRRGLTAAEIRTAQRINEVKGFDGLREYLRGKGIILET